MLDEFISAWISLFAYGYKNKAIWREQTGRAMKSYSATRWWSRWEVVEQVLEEFGDLDPFLRRDDIGSLATLSKLKAILSDSGTCGKKVYPQICNCFHVNGPCHSAFKNVAKQGETNCCTLAGWCLSLPSGKLHAITYENMAEAHSTQHFPQLILSAIISEANLAATFTQALSTQTPIAFSIHVTEKTEIHVT